MGLRTSQIIIAGIATAPSSTTHKGSSTEKDVDCVENAVPEEAGLTATGGAAVPADAPMEAAFAGVCPGSLGTSVGATAGCVAGADSRADAGAAGPTKSFSRI